MTIEQIKKPRNTDCRCVKLSAWNRYGVFWIAYAALLLAVLAWVLS